MSNADDLRINERHYRDRGAEMIAGVDEAGRGPLAGPVVGAAVILPEQCDLCGVTDSKQLSPEQRLELLPRIQETALAWSVGVVSPGEIDEINIFHAALLAMKRAVESLTTPPEALIVDGKFIVPGLELPQTAVVKGDCKSLPVACASVFAKEVRDRIMEEYAAEYPGYGFEQHKGYPTPQHRTALQKLGPCPIHRRSFRPMKGDEQVGLGL